MKYSLIFKLILWSLILLSYIVGMGVFWIDAVVMQLWIFGFVQLAAIIILGAGEYLRQGKIILPFIATLGLMYTLFIALGIAPASENAISYWYSYGFPRILLLISTIMLFRVAAQSIKYQEILDMKLNIHWMKYLILGRILYFAAFKSYHDIKVWQNLVPSNMIRKRNLKDRFTDGLSISLALVLYVLAEAIEKGEAIDNRIVQCYKEEI